jgi:hypothetical protein
MSLRRHIVCVVLGWLSLMQPVWAALTVNADGTVLDTVTGLVWDQCAYGQTGATCAGSPQLGYWQGALDVAVAANAANYKGFNDWRVPNIKELLSIAKLDVVAPPVIDTTAFPNTPGNYFWTSTTRILSPSMAWTVDFQTGLALAWGKSSNPARLVRLVRSGQPQASFDRLGLPGQTITGFNPASPVVYGDAPATLTATGGASGNPIVYATTSPASVCTVSGSTVTFTGAGTCNLTADQAGNASFLDAWQVTASIVINPAAQAITGFNPASPVVFGSAPATLTATGGASGNPIVYATTSAASVCTVSGSTVTFTGAGTCNLTADQAGNANYSAAPQVTASVVVTQAAQAITGFSPASPVVFGAAPATLTATGGASGNPIVYATTSAASVCTVSGSTVTFTGAGTCNLTADQAGNASYSAAPQVTASVVINPAAQAITGFNPASPVVFGAAPATLTATGGASGNPIVYATTSPASVCTVSGSTVTFTGAGTCNLTANQAGNTNYSAAPQVTASVVITPRASYSYTLPGVGTVTASFAGGSPTCGLAAVGHSAVTSPPSGMTMPYDLLSFSSTDCGAGATLNFTVTLPQALPAGAKFMVYGPEWGVNVTPHWYELPGMGVAGNQVTFSITDNGQGDANTTGGFITSAGSLALPIGNVSSVPTLNEWGLLLLAGLMELLTLAQRKRASKNAAPHALK